MGEKGEDHPMDTIKLLEELRRIQQALELGLDDESADRQELGETASNDLRLLWQRISDDT
jgi:hypothetical protein